MHVNGSHFTFGSLHDQVFSEYDGHGVPLNAPLVLLSTGSRNERIRTCHKAEWLRGCKPIFMCTRTFRIYIVGSEELSKVCHVAIKHIYIHPKRRVFSQDASSLHYPTLKVINKDPRSSKSQKAETMPVYCFLKTSRSSQREVAQSSSIGGGGKEGRLPLLSSPIDGEVRVREFLVEVVG